MFFVIIAVILIILVAIFLFKKCEPRTRQEVESAEAITETETTPTESTATTTPAEETATETANYFRSAFIDANVDFMCQFYQNPALAEDETIMKSTLNTSYATHGLPVDDNLQMITILDNYSNDQEVIATIRQNSAPCID